MAHHQDLDKEKKGHYIFYKLQREGTLPIYEYQCANCGRTVEAMQKITDEPLRQCPSCKGTLRRLISLTSFQLKGNGWYATDYKDKGKGKTDKRERPAEKTAEKKEEVKTDKKPKKSSTV